MRTGFISDGGTWIKNWIEDAFPEAVSILDYYYVCEHLHKFADIVFKDKEALKKWTDEQKELLLQSKVKEVIANIKNKFKNNKDADLPVNYYSSNTYRMDYRR